MTGWFGNNLVVVARLRVVRRRRWAERIVAVVAVGILVSLLLPAPGTATRSVGGGAEVGSDGYVVVAQTPTTQPATTQPTTTQPATTQAPTSTEAPGTEVAGKVVDRPPSKVLADIDQMPRTGGRDERLLAGTGWLLLGVGLLLVDAAGVMVRRRARR